MKKMPELQRYYLSLLAALFARFSLGTDNITKSGCLGDSIELFENISFNNDDTVVSLYKNGMENTLIAIWSMQDSVRNSTLINGYNHKLFLDKYGNIWILKLLMSDEAKYTLLVAVGKEHKNYGVQLVVLVAPTSFCKPKITRLDNVLAVDLEANECGKPVASVYWLNHSGISFNGTKAIKLQQGNEEGIYHACIEGDALRCVKSPKSSGYCSFYKVDVAIPVVSITSTKPVTANEDQTSITIGCSVISTGLTAVKWYFSGNKELDITNSHYSWSNSNSHSLTIYNVVETDAGNYSCFAENQAGSNSDCVTVNVSLKPRVSTTSSIVAVLEHKSSVLPCTVNSTQTFTTVWRFNGLTLTNGGRFNWTSGTTTADLSILAAQPSNLGTYTCVATNFVGSRDVQVALTAQEQASPDHEGDGKIRSFKEQGDIPSESSMTKITYLMAAMLCLFAVMVIIMCLSLLMIKKSKQKRTKYPGPLNIGENKHLVDDDAQKCSEGIEVHSKDKEQVQNVKSDQTPGENDLLVDSRVHRSLPRVELPSPDKEEPNTIQSDSVIEQPRPELEIPGNVGNNTATEETLPGHQGTANIKSNAAEEETLPGHQGPATIKTNVAEGDADGQLGSKLSEEHTRYGEPAHLRDKHLSKATTGGDQPSTADEGSESIGTNAADGTSTPRIKAIPAEDYRCWRASAAEESTTS